MVQDASDIQHTLSEKKVRSLAVSLCSASSASPAAIRERQVERIGLQLSQGFVPVCPSIRSQLTQFVATGAGLR